MFTPLLLSYSEKDREGGLVNAILSFLLVLCHGALTPLAFDERFD
jgi:hypothetical protein